MLLETTTHLGPARVVEASAPHVRIRLADQEVLATTALSSPYQPVVGDVVLAIGQEENYYVIGVIQGAGRTVFRAPGDLEFRAPKGTIDLVSTRGIRLRSPDVSVRAGRMEVVARTLIEKFEEARRWVRGLFQLRAGRVRQEVEGSCHLKAERIVERATKDVKIDGERIHLG